MRPLLRPMKEGTEFIIRVWRVDIPQSVQGLCVGVHGVKARDRNLNINDRLGRQAGNGRGAMVVDAKGDLGDGRSDPPPLRFKGVYPV